MKTTAKMLAALLLVVFLQTTNAQNCNFPNAYQDDNTAQKQEGWGWFLIDVENDSTRKPNGKNVGQLELKGLNKANMFPNPTQNTIAIDVDENIKNVFVLGTTNQPVNIKVDTSAKTVDFSEANAGVYVVVVETAYRTVERKIVVNK